MKAHMTTKIKPLTFSHYKSTYKSDLKHTVQTMNNTR